MADLSKLPKLRKMAWASALTAKGGGTLKRCRRRAKVLAGYKDLSTVEPVCMECMKRIQQSYRSQSSWDPEKDFVAKSLVLKKVTCIARWSQ